MNDANVMMDGASKRYGSIITPDWEDQFKNRACVIGEDDIESLIKQEYFDRSSSNYAFNILPREV